MGFRGMLTQLIWVGVLLSGMAAAGSVAAQLALPNCSDRCGGVEIPFPFGITEGCYLNHYFALTCNMSSGVVQTGNNISIQEGQLDILMYVAYQCLNDTRIDSSGSPRFHNFQHQKRVHGRWVHTLKVSRTMNPSPGLHVRMSKH
jgi:hypothetical protein